MLCAIFAGTLGLAYALRRQQAAVSQVQLGEAEVIGELTLRAPAGWKRQGDADGVVFIEPVQAGRTGRVLRVWQEPCDQFMTPVDYLAQTGRMTPDEIAALTRPPADGATRLRVRMLGAWPGVILSRTRWVRAGGEGAISWKQCLACTLLPQGGALLVSLEGQGEVQESDERLVSELAGGASPLAAAPVRRGGMLDLRHGMRIRIPGKLAWSAAADPFRSSRTLLGSEGAGYLAVELVPCVLPGGSEAQTRPATQPAAPAPTSALRGLIILRQGTPPPDAVKALDPRTARFAATNAGGGQVVYLRISGDGRALLADFRFHGLAKEQAEAAIGRAWAELERDVRFGREYSVASLLSEGAAARSQLPGDASVLLRQNPWEQNWQWYHETSPQTAGARFAYRSEERWVTGSFSSDGSPMGGGMGEAMHWRLRSNWTSYTSSVVHANVSGTRTAEAIVQGNRYAGVLSRGRQRQAAARQSAGPNFLPGGTLPLAIAHLPAHALILRSDWVPSVHGWAAAEPMTLLLTPADDLPRYDAEGKVLRCWRVEVSGTGRASRWYLDSHGELVSIAFGAGLHLQRAEEGPSTQPATQPAD